MSVLASRQQSEEGDAMCDSRHICIGPMASTHWRNLFLITICSTFPKYRYLDPSCPSMKTKSPKFKPSILLHKWDKEERGEKGDNNQEKQSKHINIKICTSSRCSPSKLPSLLAMLGHHQLISIVIALSNRFFVNSFALLGPRESQINYLLP
jgi:hypothetical protein